MFLLGFNGRVHFVSPRSHRLNRESQQDAETVQGNAGPEVCRKNGLTFICHQTKEKLIQSVVPFLKSQLGCCSSHSIQKPKTKTSPILITHTLREPASPVQTGLSESTTLTIKIHQSLNVLVQTNSFWILQHINKNIVNSEYSNYMCNMQYFT